MHVVVCRAVRRAPVEHSSCKKCIPVAGSNHIPPRAGFHRRRCTVATNMTEICRATTRQAAYSSRPDIRSSAGSDGCPHSCRSSGSAAWGKWERVLKGQRESMDGATQVDGPGLTSPLRCQLLAASESNVAATNQEAPSGLKRAPPRRLAGASVRPHQLVAHERGVHGAAQQHARHQTHRPLGVTRRQSAETTPRGGEVGGQSERRSGAGLVANERVSRPARQGMWSSSWA